MKELDFDWTYRRRQDEFVPEDDENQPEPEIEDDESDPFDVDSEL